MTAVKHQNAVSVAGVLLAAGQSQRMGETNKLLLPVQGRSLLQRSIDLLAASGLDPVVVALGYRLQDSAPIVCAAGLPFVVNNQYADGQQSSLRVALDAIGSEPHACMVILADLPQLKAQTLAALYQAVQTAPHADAWVPTYRGTWGNPRVLSQRWYRALCRGEVSSARELFAGSPDGVECVPVDDPGVVHDIDTPADYRAFLEALEK